MNTTTFRTDQEFFFDPQRCIGCHACEMACAECETNGQTPMIHRGLCGSLSDDANLGPGLHALRRPGLREGLPGRRDHEG